MTPHPTAHHLLRVLGRRLPRTRGRLTVDGIGESVAIGRDRWGIPHIAATSDRDAWFGLGFCHAQDRGFQLETLLRAGRGTVAALVGPEGLPIDRLSRRIGFWRGAERQAEALAPDTRAVLEAYVAGINAGQRSSPRPHELVLLRASPTAWRLRDVVAFAALQSFALAGNWDIELARLRILVADGPEALAAVDPVYAEWLPVSVPVGGTAGPVLDRLAIDLETLRGVVGGAGASNNWAIAGSRTANGRPILANDPHLGPQIPPPWYLVHLSTPAWSVAGASFVGGPALAIGHNGFAAWGITAGLTDSTDLFIEELADGDRVREGDEFVACQVVREEIEVHGAPSVTEEVLITPRGPVISPLLDGIEHALSMRAVWLDPLPLRGLLDVVRARSFDKFRSMFAEWPGPSLNVVYADTDGHVGWQLVGQLPVRRHGSGMIPQPGWDPRNGWEDDLVPFAEMPWCIDPEPGFVATANNQPVPDGEGPFLGVDWIDGYRQARILEGLGVRSDWDVASSLELQTDLLSIPWRELCSFVLGLPVADAAAGRGLALLRAWDGRVEADSPAATVFELFLASLSGRVAAAKAPRSWRWALGAGFGPSLPRTLLLARSVSHLVRLVREQPPGWFERPWAEEAAAALAKVVEDLERTHGSDPVSWGWGSLRPLTLRHPLGSRRPLDRILNVGPVPLGGDTCTPAQASVHPLDPLANPGAIANTRAVIDLGDFEASRFVLAGGQSGNPLSPHYRDLFDLWLRGEGVPIAWSAAAVERATVATLHLDPSP